MAGHWVVGFNLLGAGDKARYTIVAIGPSPSPESPPDCRIESFEPFTILFQKRKADAKASAFSFFGAGDEARTRYLHLGKVALYQMSYTREGHDVL